MDQYEPLNIEAKWAKIWTEKPFKADANSDKPPFTIVIPPPNVTGNLHLGHGLDNTIIDVLVRFKRMRGFEALYLPGMDHAGISTQVVVERQLKKEGLNRLDLGREEFLQRVWAWKEQSGGQIVNQLKRLGVSADWSRERFTMDEGLSRAVRKAFVNYFHKGLAYRGERIVNWDPVAKTVLSDLEVDRVEKPSQLYVIEYPFADGNGGIQIATQRPETIFADVAIAVHPEDERFKKFVGKKVRIPLTDRFIEIIEDSAVERDFGVGALKITPAHDPTDFEIGERHGLPRPSVIDLNAKLFGELVPEKYRGLDRFEARKIVVDDLAEHLIGTQTHTVQLPVSERTAEPIEPMLLTQWFLNVKPLAKRVLDALDAGEIKFAPERWEKVNRDWLENIRDWAIARQLWWGHQIPAWYDENGNIYVPDSENPDLDCDQDPRYQHLNLKRDPDVFDTWFSSALWPFSTLGWPDETPDLKKFYPTDVLVTGYEIIFNWVARMEMSGFEFLNKRPFHTVFLHGIYLDEKGQKMSKSKGNGIDPLELADKYGADACRFAWSWLATGGQDIRHDERRYEAGRHFANKLWNAARFVLSFPDGEIGEKTLVDRWIKSRLNQTIEESTKQLDEMDLAGAIRTIYSFVWDDFCDWYIESSKTARGNKSTAQTLRQTLISILKLLHPFMPFITSEIFAVLKPNAEQIALQNWPQIQEIDQEALETFAILRSAVSLTRSLRAELGLPPTQPINVMLNSEKAAKILDQLDVFKLLSRSNLLENISGQTLSMLDSNIEVIIPLEGTVDINSFKSRTEKRIKELEKNLESAKNKLSNPGFVNRAPIEVIEEEKRRVEEFNNQLNRLNDVLKKLDQ